MPRRLFVLDLNGTLVDSTHRPRRNVAPDARVNAKYIYNRPFLEQFREFLFAHFDVAVWTSHSHKNAIPIAKFVFGAEFDKLQFIFTRNDCILPSAAQNDHSSIKDLSLISTRFPGRWTDITLIDNSSDKVLSKNLAQFHLVPEFVASPESLKHDACLYSLTFSIYDQFCLASAV